MPRDLVSIFFPETLLKPKELLELKKEWELWYKEDMTWKEYKEAMQKEVNRRIHDERSGD